MFNVAQKHFPAVSTFFFMNFLHIVFLSMKLTMIQWITLFILGLKTAEPKITFVIKGASFYTYIHKMFKDFVERIVKTGNMKFNSPENHIPIRELSSC